MGYKLMTDDERWNLLDAISEAQDAGNEEEATRLRHTLPLAPGLAKIAREMLGKDGLLNSGFDLSEAYVEFGDDWLDH